MRVFSSVCWRHWHGTGRNRYFWKWERLIYTASCKYHVTNIMSEAIHSVLYIFSLVCNCKFIGQPVDRSHCPDAAANCNVHNVHTIAHLMLHILHLFFLVFYLKFSIPVTKGKYRT
jgi:GH18 family chitinase